MSKNTIPPTAAGLFVDWPIQEVPKPEANSFFKWTNFLEFVVEQVNGPDDFYVNLRSEVPLLQSLTKDLNHFYGNERVRKKYEIKSRFGLLGLSVASLYNGCIGGWNRGVISGIVDHNVVEIFFVDYGTKTNVHLDYIVHLDVRFCELPKQALHAKLCGLLPIPPKKGSTKTSATWSNDAIFLCTNLLNLTRKPLVGGFYAQVVWNLADTRQLPKEQLYLVVFDTLNNDGPHGLNINQHLLDKELAVKDKDFINNDGDLPWEYLIKEADRKSVMEDEREVEALRIQQETVSKVMDWLENTQK